MEMVQFHPTGLLAGTGTMTRCWKSCAARAATCSTAMASASWAYDPGWSATRATSCHTPFFSEMREGRTSQMAAMYLQMSHRAEEGCASSSGHGRCGDCGFDLAGGLVAEVVLTTS
jgi:fumarate reductase flavoprotein subunit